MTMEVGGRSGVVAGIIEGEEDSFPYIRRKRRLQRVTLTGIFLFSFLCLICVFPSLCGAGGRRRKSSLLPGCIFPSSLFPLGLGLCFVE